MLNQNIKIDYNTIHIDFVTKLNVALTTDHGFRTNIDEALKMIGNHIHSDRIHIVGIHQDMTFSVLNEWCGDSISPIKKDERPHAYIFDKALEQQLNDQNYILIEESQTSLSDELKQVLRKHRTKSMLLLPLFLSGSTLSFISFSQCDCNRNWNEDELRFLTILSSIIAANIEKNAVIARLINHIIQYRQKEKELAVFKAQLRTINNSLLSAWNTLKSLLAESEHFRCEANEKVIDYNLQAFENISVKYQNRAVNVH